MMADRRLVVVVLLLAPASSLPPHCIHVTFDFSVE
jgi:hypothetical protein